MIVKINASKIEHWSNTVIYVSNCDNLIKKQTNTNYKDYFKINYMLNNKIEEKKKIRIFKRVKRTKGGLT